MIASIKTGEIKFYVKNVCIIRIANRLILMKQKQKKKTRES